MALKGDFAVGARIGRYLLEELLGAGGMGAVYRAYDETLRRNVALKVVAGAPGEDGSVDVVSRRILREARMAASFAHPNVVAIFDVEEHEGTPFIVMEVIEGRPLRAFVGEVAPIASRIRWIVEIARALAAAHRRGLVHRDIKPENVMVSDDGTAKVLDFGIAGPTEHTGRPVWTSSGSSIGDTFTTLEGGVVSGTPAYMAPEGIKDGVFDARTDQFAWGVLAYEVLTGRHPFDAFGGGDLTELLRRITTTDPKPLDPSRLGIDPELAAGIQRALAREPDARYPTMDALLEGIGQSPTTTAGATLRPRGVDPEAATLAAVPTDRSNADTLPGSATADNIGTTRTIEVRRPSTRRRRLAILGGVGVLAVGGALTYVAMRRDPSPPPFEVESMRRVAFGAAYSEYPSLSADGKTLVYDAADGKEDQIYRMDVDSGARSALTSGAGWHYAAVLSPSGAQMAYLQYDDEGPASYVVPVDGSAPARFLSRGGLSPSWTPDGSAIWAGGKSEPRRYDADSLAVLRTLDPPEVGRYLTVLEVPDGRVAASLNIIGGRGIGILLYESDGSKRWVWRGPVEDALAAVPGAPWLLTGVINEAGVSELWQIPLDAGEPRRVGGGDVAPRTGLSISAAGDRLAWSTAHPTAELVRLTPSKSGGDLRAESLSARRQWRDDSVRSIPGTSHVTVVSDRRGANELWVIDPSGVEPPRAVTEGGAVTGYSISPDGAWIAYATGTRGILVERLDGTTEPSAITEEGNDASPTFSADSETIYFARGGVPSVEIVAVPRKGGAVTRVVAAPASFPEVSPDGRSLAYLSPEAGGNLAVHRFDLETRETRPIPGFPPGAFTGLRFAPDGRRLAAFTAQLVVEVDVEAGRLLHRFDAGIDELTGATYAGDELLAAMRVWEGDVWIAEGKFR